VQEWYDLTKSKRSVPAWIVILLGRLVIRAEDLSLGVMILAKVSFDFGLSLHLDLWVF
jgi:hypothetical protein